MSHKLKLSIIESRNYDPLGDELKRFNDKYHIIQKDTFLGEMITDLNSLSEKNLRKVEFFIADLIEDIGELAD